MEQLLKALTLTRHFCGCFDEINETVRAHTYNNGIGEIFYNFLSLYS
jgi:hypothetical protein